MTYKGYLIDLDGTLYVGNRRLPEAEEFIQKLQTQNIPFLLVTNNATRHPKNIMKRLAEQFSIQVDEQQIYTSGIAAIDYIKHHNLGTKGYVIGSEDLKNMLVQDGFSLNDQQPDFILQSLDMSLTYTDLMNASFFIQKKIPYILTNIDKQFPTEKGFIPGAGAISDLLVAATKIKPIIIGKPSHIIMEGALSRLNLDKKDVAMIGDNYQTDILSGIDNGIGTILTLTGVTQKKDIPHLPIQPTHIVNHLGEWKI